MIGKHLDEGIKILLESNDEIPTDLVERVRRSMSDVVKIIQSGPNHQLPDEYRQAQFDLDVWQSAVRRKLRFLN